MARPLADFRGERIYLGLTAIASDDEGFDRYQDQGVTLFLP